jgi:hypothetical protein
MAYGTSIDTRVLLTRLIAYHKILKSHLDQLGSDYIQLENRWRSFNAVAEGNYAEQFRSGWMRTDAQFKAYNTQSLKIKLFLDERIWFLAKLNTDNLEIYNQYVSSSGAVSASSKVQPKIEAKSSKLRDNLGKPTDNKIPSTDTNYPDGKYQAHHIIPGECADKSDLVRAAIALGFDIDSAINGIYLPQDEETQSLIKNKAKKENIELPLHSGYHKRYSGMINNILENHWQDINDKDHLSEYFLHPDDLFEVKVFTALESAIDEIKRLMIEGVLDTEDMYKEKKSSR